MVIKVRCVGVDVMGGIKRLRNRSFFSINMISITVIALMIGGGMFYNQYVINYEKQLISLVNEIYENISSDNITPIYHKMMNLDSIYRSRLEKDLPEALISRYQYYADLYKLRKINYEEYYEYEKLIKELFPSRDEVLKVVREVSNYYNSQKAYIDGMHLQQQGLIEEAIDSYRQVMFNDQAYYDLAKSNMAKCVQSIKDKYLVEANQFYENKEYIEAIKRLNYLIENGNDESVNSLKWYYQSEFYIEAMKTVGDLVEKDQLGYVIRYLNEIEPYLGTNYKETLNLKLSDMTLKRAQRRDQVLETYAQRIQVLVDKVSNQQVITYHKLPIHSSTTFNPVHLAIDSFTAIKKEIIESVEEEMVEQTINIMPYLVASSDMTDATLSMMIGYYHEMMNDFEHIKFYDEENLILSFDIDVSQKQQIWLEDKVVEWISFELDQSMISQLEQWLKLKTDIEVVFDGEQFDYQAPISMLERELIMMMLEIHQSIVK